ncbi:alpha/beta hydrolase [Dokdonia donghaensis]|uniref:Phospholipase n=1 Tax=Dokdonia donghaensis DSW-1 TaxID=1300343 RepID=A0A0A2GU08_9FLAO|nr:alpha/beta fold hydrolase [Dokdonia donghaensis]ANH60972.1 Putative hydrolase MhqD [Dokdonia donghaensis DSW-1]KGO05786.1 phospholipase [Dokdonia donghaensis DSW-1]
MTRSLEHIIQKPTITSSDKAPLLLLLHGYGSNEEDLFSFAEELPKNYFIISARAPIAMQPYGNAWYHISIDPDGVKSSDNDGARQSRDLIARFIDEAIETYDLDKHNVTLLGFSQGTILSYAVALTYPEKIKNVIGLSGYINEDIIELKSNPSYAHLNVYNSHGTVDQVIPIDAARKTPPYLEKVGISSTLSEFPVGHGVHPTNFYEFKKWLEEQV